MNVLLRNKFKTALTVLLTLLLCSPAVSALDREDIQFMAQADQNNNGVSLLWFITDEDMTAEEVEVWMEKGIFHDIEDMENPENIATLTEDDWESKSGTYQSFLEEEFETGYYTFYLSVTMTDGSVQTSNVSPVSFYNWNRQFLEFISVPENTAYAGEEYIYKAVAVDKEDEEAEIEYSLMEKPEGMSINESTGEIFWTPEEKGNFEVWVHAESKNNPDVVGEQYFYLQVYACQNPAEVSGEIIDSEGNLVDNGYIQLLPEDFMDKYGENYETYLAKVENGKYSVEADEGNYYMIYQDMYGYFQFYEDAFEIEDAKLISVECGDEITANMTLIEQKSSQYYTVSGSVTMEDGTPVVYVNVSFEGTWAEGGQKKEIFFNTYTDENGNYSIELPDGFTFIAYASGDPTNGLIRPLYYNQTYNRNEAEEILLTGDRDEVNFILDPNQGYNFYTVSGNVSSSGGTPVAEAIVIFEGSVEDEWGWNHLYNMRRLITDADGNYSVELPDVYEYRAYVVTAGNKLFKPLYYNQTYNPEEAEVIILTEDRTDIDFVIEEPDFVYYTVSGKVSREDGTPIEGAMVKFDGFNEDPDVYYNQWCQAVTTDSEGNYEMELPEIFKYVAYAFDNNFEDRNGCRMPLFYNQTYDPEEAELIELTGNRDDIHFVFGDRPDDYDASISGTVENEDGELLEDVYLMAYLVDTDDNDEFFFDGRASVANESGEFKFMSMMPGSYVILAIPKSLEYLPGFYKENDIAVLNWDEATVIEVAEDEEVTGIQIILGTMDEVIGLCQVNGKVKAKSSSYGQEDAAVTGAVIYLEGSDRKVKKYSTSNNDGSFNLKNLPNGDFILKVEKVGYQPYTKNITFDEDQSYNVGEILLTPEVLAVDDYNSVDIKLSTYPNPATDKMVVSFEGFEGSTSISLINTSGEYVLTETNETMSGSNNFTLDVSELANGAYFVVISNGVYSNAYPVTIQR
ncbi:carboxypeptidase regulatory-like domain-containing protein [Bacteroidota bacterium]